MAASDYSDVFISYRRKDVELTKQIYEALKAEEREIWVDWEDIPPGSVEFTEDIRRGIEGADAFIAVLSPDYLESDYCLNELAYAIQLNKRLVPVVARKFEGQQVPQGISHVNWIYFCEHAGHANTFEEAFPKVRAALEADFAHSRMHTRLLLRAKEWESKGFDDSFLLKGKEIQEAELWLSAGLSKIPEPTELHTRYIFAGRKAAQRRQQMFLSAAVVLALLMGILAVAAFIGFNEANQQSNFRATAQVRAERSAEESYSLALAASARLEADRGYTDLAIALALAANDMNNPPPQSQQVLYDAVFAPGTQKVFVGHTNQVRCTAISPDGSRALSGGSDNTVRLWDMATGEPLDVLEGHTDAVMSVAFSPDGRMALSGSRDGTVRLWDLESKAEIRRFEGEQSGWINSVAFSPDGKTFLAGADDKTIVLWDVESGSLIRRYGDPEATTPDAGHTSYVLSVAFSPDGKTFLSASDDTTIVLWDVEMGRIIRRFRGHEWGVAVVAFSADGKTFLSGSGDSTVRWWDVATGEELRRFQGHSKWVVGVGFLAGGEYIVSGANDNSVALWDKSGTLLHQFFGHSDFVTGLAVSPQGWSALSSSGDQTLRLWQLANGAQLGAFLGHTQPVRRVALNPDAARLLSAGLDGIILWDVRTGEEIRRFDGNGEGYTDIVTSAAISADGSKLVSGSADRSVIIWDMDSGDIIRKLLGHSMPVQSVAINPLGDIAASGAEGGTIILWDVASGRPLRQLSGHSNTVGTLAFSPDGALLVSGGADNKLILWDVTSGDMVRELEGHTGPVVEAVFSPDGSRLVSGSTDTHILVWEVADGAPIRRIEAESRVDSVVFRPDGRAILAASADGLLRLWDMETGQELRRITAGAVNGLAFLPDGRSAFAAENDGSVRLWDVTPLTTEDVKTWARENRYILPDFTCQQREIYRIEPLCPSSDTSAS